MNQSEDRNGISKGDPNPKQDKEEHHDRGFEQKRDMKHHPKHDEKPNMESEAKEPRQEVKKEMKQEQRPTQKPEHKKVNHSERKPKGRVYKCIAFVSFEDSKKIYTFGIDVDEYWVGDDVVVETIRGLEPGKIVKETETFLFNGMGVKPIAHKATERDLKQAQENIEKAGKAMEICAGCIRKLGLDMNPIEAEYTLDCSKIISVYVADECVDFRELLKELASILKCRIELCQIGPRNKPKIIGGLGTRGMEACCSRFMNGFDVVSISMAKNQLLVLNTQKPSGQCDKLVCCLKLEDSQYKRLREGLPKMNSRTEYKGSRYRITSTNVLLQQVKIENKEDVQFLSFKELWPDIDFFDRQVNKMNRQRSFENEKAILYVVTTPIGNLQEMTPRVLKVLEFVDVIATKDTRNTLKLLTHLGIHTRLISHHQHNEVQGANGLLELLRQGQDIAPMSDVGYPLISDPGCVVTQKAIEGGFNVVPISRSNAILNAPVSSDMDTKHFLFYGFLRSGKKEWIRELHELKYYPSTMVFYETPHRARKMLVSRLEILGNCDVRLARELTKKHEGFLRGTIEEILEIAEEPKGEMIIVMEGSRETKDPGEDSAMLLVHEQINTYIKEESITNEAIKRATRERGLSKNEIYKQHRGLR